MNHSPLLVGCIAAVLLTGCGKSGTPAPGSVSTATASAPASAGVFDPGQKGKIIAGTSVEGVVLGSSQAEVEKVLGKPEAVDKFSAQVYLSYYSKGLEIAINGGKVGQITCHVKQDKWQTYPGGTQEGLWVGSQRADFEKALKGQRSSSFPEALKFPTRGLWIRFDKGGTTESLSVLKPE